jgi:hypothetical protein
MKEYLACLKANQQKNEKCRMLSKKYLQCRFDACVRSPVRRRLACFDEPRSTADLVSSGSDIVPAQRPDGED